MFDFLATKVDDGYGAMMYQPTVFGYIALAMVGILLLLGISFLNRKKEKKRINTRQMVFSAIAIALAMVTSMLKLFEMPMGGSVTLCSMMFICLIGNWYGLGVGLMTGFAYGVLQLLIDPYIFSIPQMLLDYFFAFGALGLSGLFSNKKNGLIYGFMLGVFGRYICSAFSGVVFFSIYAGDMNPWLYALLYNGGYLGAEAVLTIVVFLLPPIAQAVLQVRKMAQA